MSKIQQAKDETLSIIDSALTILNRFPDLDQTDINLSLHKSTDPLPFLMDLFKRTVGYNVLIDIIAKFISWGLPVIETSIKGVLIAKLKDIISCSVNPFFTEEILRDGIVLNTEEIDIADVLKYSPFDEKIGNYFYFDTEEIEIPDDLLKSNDLNALIWYMANKSCKRHVWKPKKYRKGPEFREGYPHDNYEKLKKEDGIITLEFHRKPQGIKDAYGNSYTLQTPYNNCLHVFIGDAREKEEGETMRVLLDSQTNLQKEEKQIELFSKKIDNLYDEIYNLEDAKNELKYQLEENNISIEDYQKEYKKTQKKIDNLQEKIDNLISLRNKAYDAKHRFQYAIQEAKNTLQTATDIYFPFINDGKVRNYYYGKSLIEFNIDYITSLQLFDAKSLTARLFDCLTASLVIDLNLSYKQQLIKNEVKKLVQMVTESDDLVISDCFFTFSNNDYDEMTRKAELRKAGLLTINGDETSAVKVNADEILSNLNEINKDSNKETVQSIISGAITELSKELSNTEYLHTDNVNFGVEINFIENILSSLAEALTMTVLSPKVYLLLLINLKIIGRETNFNLEGFLMQYRQLIADIIRSIRDIMLEYLTKEIMIIVGDLVTEIARKLSIEQALYWQRLLKKLIDCFKNRKQKFNIDFSIDDVDYADILPSEQEPENNEC